MASEKKTRSFLDPVTRDEVHALGVYRLLGNSGLRVSRVTLGAMSFGDKWTQFLGGVSKEEAEKMFNRYCDLGGNFIDTACNYQDGQSEEWLGEFIEKRGNRDSLVIATKYSLPTTLGQVNSGGNHRKNMFQTIERSLKRLRTSYVDIYYVHFHDSTTPAEEVMRGLNDLVRMGKVLHLAVSDAPSWWVSRCNTIAELRGWAPFVCYQGKYHLGERDMEREIIPMCESLKLGVVPWNVLGGGKWTGKYSRSDTADKKFQAEDAHRAWVDVSERDWAIIDVINDIAKTRGIPVSHISLMWALSKNTFPLIGCRKLSQLDDNLQALENFDNPSKTLTEEDIKRLDAASKFDIGFPLNFLGGPGAENCRWIKPGGYLTK